MSGVHGDVLGAANPAHIESSKAAVAESKKAAIFLDRVKGHKYKQLKDDLENKFSKDIDNYPPTVTVERTIHLLNTYKIKFDYIKKGVYIMSNEEEVAFIERG